MSTLSTCIVVEPTTKIAPSGSTRNRRVLLRLIQALGEGGTDIVQELRAREVIDDILGAGTSLTAEKLLTY